jgi:hypothetical protein
MIDVGSRTKGILTWVAVAGLGLALALGGQRLIDGIEAGLGLSPDSATALSLGMFVVLLMLYTFLLALPFVPGAELGIVLLMAGGAKAALPVYGATVAALLLAFAMGRLVPPARLEKLLRSSGLGRAADLLSRAAPASAPVSSPVSTSASPGEAGSAAALGPLGARLLRHRCVVLGLLLNTPGNAVLGGGGGIAMAAGASRLLSPPQFIATVLIAVAPVPATVLFAAWLAPG